MLVSEPTTDKAAAAMDIAVGSFSDPEDYAGLAHFCGMATLQWLILSWIIEIRVLLTVFAEHMLFLGTEKYPAENSYAHFLSQHAGRSNAYTSAENTNYHFAIEKDYLKPILDM